MKIWRDGNFVDADDARVNVFSSAAMWGRGLYEKTRIYQGWPFRLADHIARLEKSAKALGMKLPKSFELLADGIASLIAENRVEDGLVFILLVGDIDDTKVFARIEPLLDDSDELAKRGVRAMVAIGPLPIANHQTCQRWVKELHMAKARAKKLDEVVIISPEGIVLEALEAAVCFIKNDVVYLPSNDLPILSRVSVETFVAAARRIGLETKRLIFYPIDLYKADEALLVSSVREVLPLVELEGKPVGGGTKGSMYQRLAMAYRDLVFEEIKLRG